jgi:hypothetical protein
MNAFSHRTWIPFYLISFSTLSIAVFRSMNGLMLLFSLILITAALGVIFMTIQAEVEKNSEREELMEILSEKVRATGESEGQPSDVTGHGE